MSDPPKIAVLGAGVVGMTLARLLQEKKTKYDITIITKEFKNDTLSLMAGGIFRPGNSFKGPTDQITQKWISDSWFYWQDILNSPEATQAGLMAMPACIFSNTHVSLTRNPLIEHLVPTYRPVDKNEMSIYGCDHKYGASFSTIRIGCDRYLPWAGEKFLQQGGKLHYALVKSFSDLAGEFDLVFNCTGFGARYFCNDLNVIPIRGQIINVMAPWVKMAMYDEYDTYIIPGFNGIVTLGGVRQFDSYNLDYSSHDSVAIFERCCQLMPSLKNAQIIEHLVGLRPYRAPVRVEPEIVDDVKVVHCYGHGGYGITSAPGTAMAAVDMGIALLKQHPNNKL